MSTSRVPAVIDALVGLLEPAVVVPRLLFDGPVLEGDASTDDGDAVYVGWSGDLEDFTAAELEQEWAGLGALRRNETITIRGCCVRWSGDDDPAAIKLRRDAVATTFGLVETALRGAVDLGLPNQPTIGHVAEGALIQEPLRARIPWTVSLITRI